MNHYAKAGTRRRRRGGVAVFAVALGLVVAGLPAAAAPQPSAPKPTASSAAPASPAPKAPDAPPVAPPLAEVEKPPAPPFPVGPVPAVPKAGDEVLDRRTERSKTFATAKVGQFRTELYSERVHYKDAKGVYQEIDAELAPSKDGVRKTKANAFVLELADDANAAAVARLRLDDAVSVGSPSTAPLR